MLTLGLGSRAAFFVCLRIAEMTYQRLIKETTVVRSVQGKVIGSVDARPGVVLNDDGFGHYLATTTADERSDLFRPSDDDLAALADLPPSSPRHKQAVAAVERAITELRELKDRKCGYLPHREEA